MAKFCPECGFEQHNDENRFCSNCGFDFSKLDSKSGENSSDKSSSGSSTKTTKTYSPKTSQNDFLSNLSFNKCFLAFAILLIFLVVLGMISEATQTEPYSDNGLTSFMESSSGYGLSDFIEDSDNYYYDSDSEYLKYGGDGEVDIFQ